MENSWLQDRFHLQKNQTTVGREFIAGLTTFMTMAYILVVNPNILSDAGMDKGAVFVATIVGSVIATVLMGLLANYPFALAPGMGLNAFFAYTVVIEGGYSWQFALTAVFIEGLLFILLSFFNVRELIIKSIPLTLKNAVSAGIGLFIAYIGLSSIGLIVKEEEIQWCFKRNKRKRYDSDSSAIVEIRHYIVEK